MRCHRNALLQHIRTHLAGGKGGDASILFYIQAGGNTYWQQGHCMATVRMRCQLIEQMSHSRVMLGAPRRSHLTYIPVQPLSKDTLSRCLRWIVLQPPPG